MDIVNVETFTLNISDIRMEPLCIDESVGMHDQLWSITICGSAFLWHQIRFMLAILFTIGKGNESCKVIEELLDEKTFSVGKPQYEMASDVPLILYDCVFDEKDVKFENTTSIKTFCLWHQRWREHLIQSNVMRIFWQKSIEGIEEKDAELDKVYKEMEQLKLPRSRKKNKRQSRKYVKLMDRTKEPSFDEKIKTMTNSKLKKYQRKQETRELHRKSTKASE